jgi:hypothetical protein
MMQRLRDQIKSWISIGSTGVKDKELLVEEQKSILTNNDSLGEHAAAASSESFLGGRPETLCIVKMFPTRSGGHTERPAGRIKDTSLFSGRLAIATTTTSRTQSGQACKLGPPERLGPYGAKWPVDWRWERWVHLLDCVNLSVKWR